MYIKSAEITNIRSISQLKFELEENEYAGWHVILGDNGSGKSTVLQAMALALIGGEEAHKLPVIWNKWIRQNLDIGLISLSLLGIHPYDSMASTQAEIKFERKGSWTIERSGRGPELAEFNTFSAAYGPFRRFTGGENSYQDIYRSNPKLAAHLSVFAEGIALTETLKWLRELKFKQLENRPEANILNKIIQFINHPDLLPYDVKLTSVSSEGVFFNDANGNDVSIENLSDGYRSILSMTVDMIRQMQIAYETDDLFNDDFTQVIIPGVVLIDEVDAHLHPTWQKRVGKWFREHFPNIQFIVTTHSPLVCQAAEVGSIWKLPRPGSDETFYRVEGQELDRLLYGNVLEAYSTQLFELTTTRSESAKDKLERLAELNTKEVFSGLSDDERQEQSRLRAMLPTAAGTTEASE